MRLARLVAAGLVAGVITGFVVALLRPRRSLPRPKPADGLPAVPEQTSAVPGSVPVLAGSDVTGDGEPSPAVVLDVRTRRSVKG